MPISNPSANTSSSLILETKAPTDPPSALKIQWVDITTGRMWISKAATSVSDWVLIAGGEGLKVGTEILDRILVANGEVVTDGKNVVYR
jgi:hypothetical protein